MCAQLVEGSSSSSLGRKKPQSIILKWVQHERVIFTTKISENIVRSITPNST